MDNQDFVVTPPMSDLGVKSAGNPLQLRGLSDVISASYYDGIGKDELELIVASKVKEQLESSLESLQAADKQVVLSFLQGLDYNLTLNNAVQVREDNNEIFK